MLKDKMTLTEMVQYLEDIGHDTFFYDSTVVEYFATTELGYESEIIDDEFTFIKK